MRALLLMLTFGLVGCAGLGGVREGVPRFDRPDNVQRYDAYCLRVRNNLDQLVHEAGQNGFRLTALSDQAVACFDRPSR